MYEGGTTQLDVGIFLHQSGIATADNAENSVATDTIAIAVDAHLTTVTSHCFAVLALEWQVERPLLVSTLVLFIAEVALHTYCHVGVCHLGEGTIAAAEHIEVRVGIVAEGVLPNVEFDKVGRHSTVGYLHTCTVCNRAGEIAAAVDVMVIEELRRAARRLLYEACPVGCAQSASPCNELLVGVIPQSIPYCLGTIHIYLCLSVDVGTSAHGVVIGHVTPATTEHLAGEASESEVYLSQATNGSLVAATVDITPYRSTVVIEGNSSSEVAIACIPCYHIR